MLDKIDYEKLQDAYVHLSIINTQNIKQQLLSSKQKIFECKDKLEKSLAYVLVERGWPAIILKMQSDTCE